MSDSTFDHLLNIQAGKMHQVSSQNRQKPRGAFAKMIGSEPGKMVEIDPGETFTLADIPGAGKIVRIWMTTMNFPGATVNFNDYGVLKFYWDGEKEASVEVPFGAFFGVPWGKYTHYISAPLSCTSGGYNCNFPMPFSNGCRLEVTNQSSVTWPGLFFQIQYIELEEQPSPIRFHALWKRENPTRHRVPYRILEAEGQGHFVGVHLFMQNTSQWLNPPKMWERYQNSGSILSTVFPEMAGMGMLEGWELIRVDDEAQPSIIGTGTEDYFNSGFYYLNGTYSAPYWGCTVRSYLKSRCATYRFHIPDPIAFKKSIQVDIDHGYTSQVEGDYQSVAYWYQTEPHLAFPGLPTPELRLPIPTTMNTAQFAAFTSPIWIPAGIIGLKLLKKCFRRC